MNINNTIKNYLIELDIDNIHQDLARSLCKRVGALSFIPFHDWMRYESMEASEMKEHLMIFKKKNECDIAANVEHNVVLTYEEVHKSNQKFKPELLAITKDDGIRRMIIDGYEDMSVSFAPKTLEGKDRCELIYSFYESLTDFTTHTDKIQFDLTTASSVDSEIDSLSDTNISKQMITQPPEPPKVTPLKRAKPSTPDSSQDKKTVPKETSHLPIDYTPILLKLTFVQLELLARNEMLPYLVFLGNKFDRRFRSDFFHSASAREIRENLIVYIMELHSHHTQSLITESTTKEHIEEMEAFIAYNEYFLNIQENKPTFQELIMKPIQYVKKDLI